MLQQVMKILGNLGSAKTGLRLKHAVVSNNKALKLGNVKRGKSTVMHTDLLN